MNYSKYGVYHFIICAGYKSEAIKKYFSDLYHLSDFIDIDYKKNKFTNSNFKKKKEFQKWRVQIVDTGLYSNTGWRIKKLKNILKEIIFI